MDNITDLELVVKHLSGRNFLTDKPCKKCGISRHVIKSGKGPHVAQYRCGQCLSFISWVPKSELIKLYRES